MTFFSIVPQLWTAAEVFTAILAMIIFASSLDDLHIDARYWWRRLRLLLGRRATTRLPTREEIRRVRQEAVAIVVPAWHESGVIAQMLGNTTHTLEYENYMVFVGTYPNDAATGFEVDDVVARDRRIRRIELPHAGPTCKADCLNHIVKGVLEYERVTGARFSAFVLHDSEDALHPLELQYFNAMLPRYEMIQLPVVALERSWSQLVAGTYMDEFAESHAKEMMVRQHLSGTIPSAGVGTCISRGAILALVSASDGQPFRTDSLTEDYEIGMRLSEYGMRSRFVWLAPDGDAPAERGPLAGRMLSVREYFPHEFHASCRQKARWMLGIGLQAWHHVPLKGRPWSLRYMMLHDRKAIFTSLIPAGAYLVVLYVLLHYVGVWAGWWPPQEPKLFREGSPWLLLLYANVGFLLLRAVQRAYFTGSMYGWRQGLAALPRMVVGNIVNCAAAFRAWRLYLAHRITGKALAWDKTAHQYPELRLVSTQPQPLDLELIAGMRGGRITPDAPEHTESPPAVAPRAYQAPVDSRW